MYKGIYAALIGAAVIGASVTAFADEPQPSAAYNWVMQQLTASAPLAVGVDGVAVEVVFDNVVGDHQRGRQ